MSFSEFHARSAFSFLRGASLPEKMVRHAEALGLRSIAMTDHEGFYGSVRAFDKAKDLGIRVITGATLEWDGAHLPVLCATREGYRSLSRHLTDRHLDQCRELLAVTPGDLIALTGDREGPVIRHLLRDDREAALQAVKQLVAAFGQGNVYVEILRHGLRDDGRLNRYLIDLAEHLKLPLLASNAPLYIERKDRRLADAFTCLRHKVTLDAAGRLLEPNGQRFIRGPQEMKELFRDLPEAITNTRRLDDRIGFTLENLGYRFPNFRDTSGRAMTMEEQTKLLREKSIAGLKSKYGECSSDYLKKIDEELTLIHKLGFSGYFLIVQDLILYARSQGIICQGRGSAANSMVCFALGITRVNAVDNHLVFARFLADSPGREVAWPDIDIDFPSGDQREKVIQYVFRKYGPRGAAMTANVIRYRSRSAFREMSKVLGFPPSVADRFSSIGSSPDGPWQHSRKDKTLAFDERTATLIPPSHPRLHALARLYKAALKLPRHLSQHSGGIIIQDSGLDEVVPIQPATMPGRTIVQWDKEDCEDLGIVKIDLLGLGFLAAMEDAIEISARRGRPVDFDADPTFNDPEVYDLLKASDTIGTFQVESRAQMATLSILKPEKFYDIAIQVAIVRPGPIVGDLMNPYLRRRQGLEEPDCIHDSFKEDLNRTLGVPLFQEQVLSMAMKIADFSGAEAHDLRRAMSFNRSDERLKRVTDKLRERMTERNVAQDVQEKVIHATGNFALYGFPESHAISFAFLAYQSCWLKIHRTEEFFAGLINHQPMGFYSVHTLIQDAKRRGVKFLPISCVHSSMICDVPADRTVRLGLNRLKGVTAGTLERLIREREKQSFLSLEDFLKRVRPGLKERRILAKAGALNDLPEGLHRRQALWQAELPLHDDLIGGTSTVQNVLPPMTLAERLSADFSIQSASTGPHPMKLWREKAEWKILTARELQIMPAGMPVTVGGLVICRQRPGTANGHCFISLEDETGIANLFVPQKTFQRLRLIITTEHFLLGEGKVQISAGNQATVFITEIRPLPGAQADHSAKSHDFH